MHANKSIQRHLVESNSLGNVIPIDLFGAFVWGFLCVDLFDWLDLKDYLGHLFEVAL